MAIDYSRSAYGSASYNAPLPAGQNKYGYKELENRKFNAQIVKILRYVNLVFRAHYTPNVENKGDTATYIATMPNRRIKYGEHLNYNLFKTPVALRASLPNNEFGCYGGAYNRDFAQMAIDDPDKLNEFIDEHYENTTNELNNDLNRKYKEDLNNNDNFPRAPHGILRNPDSWYEAGTTNGLNNAEIVWNSIYRQASNLCRRSYKYNAASNPDDPTKYVWSNYGSLKDIVLLLNSKVYAMIKGHLYAGSFHPEEVKLEPIFGIVGIMDFSDHQFSTDRFDATTGENMGYGDWYESDDRIIMLGKDSYKICDAINPPIWIDTTRMGISLKTYFFKWFFAFCGFIKFMNACKWKATDDDGKDLSTTTSA